jgi:hypothetical protein
MTRIIHDGTIMFLLNEAEADEYQSLLRETGRDEMWGRKDIANYLGISPSRLSECPWLFPFFGQGMKRKRNATWTKREVVQWNKKSPMQLKEEYLASFGH